MIKRIIKILLLVVIVIVIGIMLINNRVVTKYEDRIISKDYVNKLDNVDAIVVLGAKVNDKKQVSLMLKDRLDRGIDVFNTGVSDVILMSGAGNKVNNEVEAMKNYAMVMGIDEVYIKKDGDGINTSSSMFNLVNNKYKKVIIITQKYHMYRALYIANEIGLDAYGVIAKEKEYKGQFYRDLREVMARCKDFVLVRSK